MENKGKEKQIEAQALKKRKGRLVTLSDGQKIRIKDHHSFSFSTPVIDTGKKKK